MAPVLYYCKDSPPSRAVLITAKTIGLDLEIKNVNLRIKEQLDPEFVKINPQHTVPTLVDDDFVLWDSHAIMGYLINKYAKDDSLYPKEPRMRAVVDQRLHFDSSVLFENLKTVFYPMVLEGKREVPDKAKEDITRSYQLVDIFLKGKQWIAGDNLSIADFCFVAILTQIGVFLPLDKKSYPNLAAWLERCETLEHYSINKEGVEIYNAAISKLLGRA